MNLPNFGVAITTDDVGKFMRARVGGEGSVQRGSSPSPRPPPANQSLHALLSGEPLKRLVRGGGENRCGTKLAIGNARPDKLFIARHAERDGQFAATARPVYDVCSLNGYPPIRSAGNQNGTQAYFSTVLYLL